MASSTGPVKADKAAIISTTATMTGSASVAARGRSTSPGQYTSLSARGARGQSHGQTSSTMTAWPEGATGTLASPRTPRGTHGAPDLRLGVAVVEIQRQAEQERRNMSRQIAQLERKFQDQLSAPAVGRERWADLQGMVNGMLEEQSAFAKRVESLDEKLRLRIGGCEELTRTRTRELEQQIIANVHKAHLATSTHEETQKRQSAKIRKVTQLAEDHTRRLDAIEEVARRQDSGHEGSMLARLEARLLEMEQRQFGVEEEVRSLFASGARSSGAAAMMALTMRGSVEGVDSGKEESQRDDANDVLRSLEHELSSLAQRTASQLDEHSAALSALRVRTDGQEKRLTAAAERLETVVSPPLEALRMEVQQGRDHDRQELENRLDTISRRLQELVDATDESVIESSADRRDMRDVHEFEQLPIIKKLSDASAIHQQALHRLESLVGQSQQGNLVTPEEICGLLMRADSIEQRVDFLEKDTDGHGLEEKADRTELLRVEAALRELSDPLRRLSQRAAAAEGKTTALERRVEHLQQLASQERSLNCEGGASSTVSTQSASEDVAAALMRVDVISNEVAELRARIVEVEGLTESGVVTPRQSPKGESIAKSSSQSCHENGDISDQVAELRQRVQELTSREASSPIGRHYTDQLDQALNRRIASLERGLAECKDHAKSKESVEKRLEEGLTELKSCFDDMGPSTSSSVQQYALDKEVQGRFAQQQESLNSFQSSWQEQSLQLASLLKAYDELSASLEKSGDKCKSVEQSVEKLRVDQNGMCSTISDLAHGVKTAQTDLDKLLHEHKGRLDELDKLSTAVSGRAAIEESVARLQADLQKIEKDTEQQLAKSMDKVAADVDTRMATLEKDIGKARIDEDDENLKSIRSEMKSLRADADESIASLKCDMGRLREDVSDQLKNAKTQEDSKDSVSADGIVDALQRISSGEEAAASLHESLEALRCSMEKSIAQVIEDSEKQTQRNDDLFGRLESMEQRLKDLDKVGSGDAAVAQVDISKRVAEALAHTEKNEEELDKLQKMMQESVKALDMKLESLSSVEQNGSKESNLEKNESQLFERMSRSEEEVKKVAETLASLQKGAEASQTTLKELGQRVMKAEAMVEASEAATMAVREELMCAPVRSSSAQDHQEVASGHETVLPEATLTKLEEQVAGFSKQVADELQELVKHQATLATMKEASANTESLTAIEDQVQDLAAKVAEELSELRGHQKELGKAKDSIGSMAKVEEDVHEMYKQVAEELKELRAHQKDLGKARDLLTQGEHRRPLEALSEGSPQLEAKVEELSREVVAELKSLASHQNELNGTKANMQDLAERMDDNTRALAACQKATSELKEEMESLKAKALLSDNRKPSLEPLNFGKKEVKSESKKSPKTSPTSAAESSKSAPEMESTNSSREEARPCGVQSPVRSGLGPLGRMGLSTQAAQNTSKEEEEAQNTSIAEEISDGSMSYGHEAFDEADEDSMSAS